MVENLRVAIAGGSIGGLTAACLLRDAGYEVTLFERSSRELEQRGAGIGLLEAASRYLVSRAGVDIDEICVTTPLVRYLDRNNAVVYEQRYQNRFSSWNTVYQRMLGALDAERYHLGKELSGWSLANGDVELEFTDGHSSRAQLLLCADGVGSASRARLLPETRPLYAGYVAWRGVVPEAELPSSLAHRLAEAITYYVYANSHILVYPIPALDGSIEPGRRLMNFVWYRNYLEGAELDHLLTDNQGVRRSLSVPQGMVAEQHCREVRASARARLPSDIAHVVLAAKDLFVQVIFDILVKRMVFGQVCLLGDAAFVARPHAAAGTAKAAEDGWVLVQALQNADSLREALTFWETSQLCLGRALVERARAIGGRSQVNNNWVPGDPDLLFGLYKAGAR